MNSKPKLTRPHPVGDVTTIIIGAGQAGLATSRCLDERGIDHVILERGEIANTWRTERWDSMCLLTPNWQCQLPGYKYRGDKPENFMDRDELVRFFDSYAQHINAPVHAGTEVLAVSPHENGYRVETNRGVWQCRTLVVASGAYNIPRIPRYASALPSNIRCLTAHQYRKPQQLEDGGVLVVGASATGIQFAQEIQQTGRPVTLCVGEHVRMPRRYRGQDILSWLDRIGLLNEDYRQVDDIRRARRLPSAQLLGTKDHSTLDLNALGAQGVQLVGRLAGVYDNTLQFSGALDNVCKMADLKMHRMLRGIDEWISAAGLDAETDVAEDIPATATADTPVLEMKLNSGEIKTVIWACGFRPDYAWLKVPVVDRKGSITHDGGVTEAPGLYAMGLPFMRRRKSGFIYGVGDDARDISDHLQAYVAQTVKAKLLAVA